MPNFFYKPLVPAQGGCQVIEAGRICETAIVIGLQHVYQGLVLQKCYGSRIVFQAADVFKVMLVCLKE